MIFPLLAAAWSLAAPAVEVETIPVYPIPATTFRMGLLVKNSSCQELKLSPSLPAGWEKMGETRTQRGPNCKFVLLLYAKTPGEMRLESWKLASPQQSFALEGTIKVRPPLEALKAASVHSATDQARAWVEQFKLFLGAYAMGGPVMGEGAFSVDNCRPPTMQVMRVLSRQLESITYSSSFRPGCDTDGKVVFQLDTPLDLKVKTRNLAGVEAVEGTIKIQVEEKGTDLLQKTDISNATAYMGGGAPLARFSMSHARVMSLGVGKLKPVDIENKGLLQITEFKGKPVSVSETLVFAVRKTNKDRD